MTNISGIVTHSVKLPTNRRTAIRDFLPPNYVFTANNRYKIAIISDFAAIYSCPGTTTVFSDTQQSCVSNLQKTFNIENGTLIFTPYISGVLYQNASLNGGNYIGAGLTSPPGYDTITYALIPLDGDDGSGNGGGIYG